MYILSQGGIQLQKDVSLEDLWLAGMEAYRTNEWQTVIDQLEEAIRAFDAYQNATLLCLQQCSQNGEDFGLATCVGQHNTESEG